MKLNIKVTNCDFYCIVDIVPLDLKGFAKFQSDKLKICSLQTPYSKNLEDGESLNLLFIWILDSIVSNFGD